MVEKKPRGFAVMDPAKQREIARKGGRNIPAKSRTFFTDRALAASAGSTGGRNTPAKKRAFYKNRALAIDAGRKGGRATRKPKSEATPAE